MFEKNIINANQFSKFEFSYYNSSGLKKSPGL